MTVKTCNKCKKEKLLSDFNKKNKEKFQPYCRKCDNEHAKEYYKINKEKQKKQIYAAKKIRTENTKKIIRDIKESTPCYDCGKKYPYYVIDFDHLRDKEFNVSNMAYWASIKKIEKEIEKCEIVCSNCHRIRTHNRLNRA
jgi:hypothetical protein